MVCLAVCVDYDEHKLTLRLILKGFAIRSLRGRVKQFTRQISGLGHHGSATQ